MLIMAITLGKTFIMPIKDVFSCGSLLGERRDSKITKRFDKSVVSLIKQILTRMRGGCCMCLLLVNLNDARFQKLLNFVSDLGIPQVPEK
jgi:hypothetical protein